MIYLLDADSLIRGDRTYYPMNRFPVFWDWLLFKGESGQVKIPLENYEEITSGRGELVDWLKEEDVKNNLVLQEQSSVEAVSWVIDKGYADDLDDAEVGKLGRDPFLISYGVVNSDLRTVVTLENSRPSAQRANRKVPDVCNRLGVQCVDLFQMINLLDFSTNWTR